MQDTQAGKHKTAFFLFGLFGALFGFANPIKQGATP
jgi:hypothetical protein